MTLSLLSGAWVVLCSRGGGGQEKDGGTPERRVAVEVLVSL